MRLLHRHSAEVHAIRRLYQRCGIIITASELRALSAECRDGRSPVLAQGRGDHPKRGTIHMVYLRGRSVYVAFRADIGTIITFLPGIPEEIRNAP